MTNEEFANYIKENPPGNVYEFEVGDFLKKNNELTGQQFFFSLARKIPNIIAIDDIDVEIFFSKLFQVIELKNNMYYKGEFYSPKKEELIRDESYHFLAKEIYVHYHFSTYSVRVFYGDTVPKEVIEYFKELSKECILDVKMYCNMFLVTEEGGKLSQRSVEIPKEIEIDINANYNDDFQLIHELILKRLSTPEDKGVVLLHGMAGTGKTHYLRYLMGKIKKNFVVIPSAYAHYLGSKEFMTFLLGFKNAILILEDAEEAIRARSQFADSAVTNLLNMSDGLFSDALKIQVILTCNIMSLKEIDSALLRKGRLIARYHFSELEKTKAQKLMYSLGNEITVDKAMTLAEIYNHADLDFSLQEKNQIGFNNER